MNGDECEYGVVLLVGGVLIAGVAGYGEPKEVWESLKGFAEGVELRGKKDMACA